MRKIDIAGKGTLALTNEVLRLSWKPGETVGVKEANSALTAIAALGQGACYPLLISFQGVTFSRDARKIFPSPSAVSRIALLGSSPVDQVLALFLLGCHQRPCPIKYFTSSRKAMTWLHAAAHLSPENI
jgi:hypothetical protein